MKGSREGISVAFVFARGGSKGVPRKNVKDLNGQPLIAYSIKTALASPSIDRVVVSTDDQEIANVAKAYGAEVPFMRPTELAEDKSSEFEAWKHAVSAYQEQISDPISVFVSLPPTSPLRSVDDVEKCVETYITTDADMVVTVKNASRSPYFNMIKNDQHGHSTLVNLAPDGKRYVRRQDVPEVFDMTTVAYVSCPEFILGADSIFSGVVRSVVVPDERAIDIDTMLDFEFAAFLANKEK